MGIKKECEVPVGNMILKIFKFEGSGSEDPNLCQNKNGSKFVLQCSGSATLV